MKIAISGASGFIGTHLSAFLSKEGHQIIPLGRELFHTDKFTDLSRLIAQSDVVVNLAGAPINRRWSPDYKKTLHDSRIIPTTQLVRAINAAQQPPKLFISASATGYYPSQGCHDEYDHSRGDGFLADLCHDWETAARKVNDSTRLVITRFGIVLAQDGGAFRQFRTPLRLKTAPVISPGNQPFCWISLEDLLRGISFIIANPKPEGVFNMVAPQQLSNTQFARLLAQYYHTYITLRIPALFFRLLYGEGATFLTQGQCVLPTRLTEAGFSFTTSTISQFLSR